MFFKIRLIVLGLLLTAAVLAMTTTLLLNLGSVREEFARQLGERLGSEIGLESLELAWLPLPHLLVRGVEFEHPQAKVTLGEVQLYPRWRALWRRQIEMGRIILEAPLLLLAPGALQFDPDPDRPTIRPLPAAGELLIRRGTVALTGSGELGGVVIAPLQLAQIDGRVIFSPSRLTLELESRPSFGAALALQGWYEAGGAHQLNIDGRALRLHEAVISLAHGRITPLETLANLNLELARQSDGWQLLIRNLEVKKPDLQLAGVVGRRLVAGDDGPVIPHWQIELTGRDLDAGQIRAAVLAMLGNYRVARQACDIVLDGRAGTASFHFAGPESDLTDFRTMAIAVEVETAEIMVPAIDLHLQGAAGSLSIRDGIMELRQARATLGESRGRDGSLTVGLLRELRDFKLDLAIDATWQDLHQVLPGLIKHPVFQAEAARFHRPSGQASGRLRIGNSLDDFQVQVSIEKLRGRADNDHLPWPLEVESAQAVISRQEVRWSALQGGVGPHRIIKAGGRIGLDETAPFVLEELEATLAAAALLDHLQSYPPLEKALDYVLQQIEGEVEVKRGEAAGRLWQPADWSYQLELVPRRLSWHSPLLAADIHTFGGTLLFSNHSLELRELESRLHGDPLTANGTLRHQQLRDWQGELRLDGMMTAAGRQWLQERDWLPAWLLPQPPLLFEPLILHREIAEPGAEPASSGLEGLLLSGPDNQGEPAALRFSAVSNHRGELVLNAELQDGDRQAKAHLTTGPPPAGGGLPAIQLEFGGELAASSLGRFFSDPLLVQGLLRGEGRFRLPAAAGAPLFSGKIEAEGFKWRPDPEADAATGPLEISSLRLSGRGDELLLHHLELAFTAPQQLRIGGAIRPDPAGGLAIDLELSSPLLHRPTLLAWRERLRQELNLRPAAATGRWPLAGSVAFKLDEFVFGPVTELASELEPGQRVDLTWQPLHGRLDLHRQGGMTAEIDSGIICCLEVSGTWHSEPALGLSNFRITSACPESSRFEEILPCFGIDQDLISGDCLLEAELYGEPSYFKKGLISVRSPGGGRIMRLKLLSRIFSLVNLTDIFSGGIAGLDERGFAYRQLDIEGRIKDNVLVLERAVVRGEGLNLFVRGSLDLSSYQADLLVLIAPFKTLDTIVGRIPFIGRALGGPDATVITIPVGVRGDVRAPEIIVLPPEAVGEGMLNLVRNTLLLPFNILSPLLPSRPPPE